MTFRADSPVSDPSLSPFLSMLDASTREEAAKVEDLFRILREEDDRSTLDPDAKVDTVELARVLISATKRIRLLEDEVRELRALLTPLDRGGLP